LAIPLLLLVLSLPAIGAAVVVVVAGVNVVVLGH
jgi:hypothetical protein